MAEEAPLSPHEVALLKALEKVGEADLESLAREAAIEVAQARGAVERLKLRGFADQVREEVVTRVRLTTLGDLYAQKGTPEKRILERVRGASRTPQELQAGWELDKKIVGSAFGSLKQGGYLKVEGGQVTLGNDAPFAEEHTRLLERIRAAGEVEWSTLPEDFQKRYQPRKRGGGGDEALELKEDARRFYRLSEAGRAAATTADAAAASAPAQLTADMLKTGEWRRVLETTGFRRYAFAAPPVVAVGRRDPYREFLDATKRKLLALGFEEMTGHHVETEFWDMDALFLPQFHPARQIHDVYFVAEPTHATVAPGSDEARTIEAVAREHEGRGVAGSAGWGYDFDRERTNRLVLRSQGTALSARWLARKDLKDPGKYFAMARCFRYDTVDATHAPDFFQVEGIVVSKDTTFRHLLGLLELFAREVARAKEVKYVPAYFPFTEPSVELHARHPDLGWIELGGAGVFRPEVCLPHGVTSPVIAWGLGLDRMAMVALGLKDIRHLFTNNAPEGLASVRERVAR